MSPGCHGRRQSVPQSGSRTPHATESPASKAAPPEPKTSSAPYTGAESRGYRLRLDHDGVGSCGGGAGGSVSVNTSDLDSLASSLTSAAGSLDDARTLIANVVTEVSMAPSPLPPTAQFGPLTSNIFFPSECKVEGY